MAFLASACGQDIETGQNQRITGVPSMPLTGRVVDQADLLTDEAESELVGMLATLERTAGPQFVIATTESLDGRKIADYSVDLARSWGIGDKRRNDGVLLLVAPNERMVRIEVGYGLEASLSDPFCASVIREEIIPAFSDGKMEEGIFRGAARLMEKMQQTPTISTNDNATETSAENRKAS